MIPKKYCYDGHCVAATYDPGDIVLVVRKMPEQTGTSMKTQVTYRGPLVVTKELPADTYRNHAQHGVRRSRPTMKQLLYDALQLKLFRLIDEDENIADVNADDDHDVNEIIILNPVNVTTNDDGITDVDESQDETVSQNELHGWDSRQVT